MFIFTVCGLTIVAPGPAVVSAQQATGTASVVYITVTYAEPVNIRSGPSTVYYQIVGQLSPGDTAPALGVSPGREWIQISFPGGVGWVYSSYVSLSPGALPVVEPPPTATPLASPTYDPTLAAAFDIQATATRLPTFTPPAPLVVPVFTETATTGNSTVSMGGVILGLILVGIVGLLVSFFLGS